MIHDWALPSHFLKANLASLMNTEREDKTELKIGEKMTKNKYICGCTVLGECLRSAVILGPVWDSELDGC